MPRQTGNSGLPSRNQPMISVPPEIDCTGTCFTARATHSNWRSCGIESVDITLRKGGQVERLAGRVAEFLAKREIGGAGTKLGHPAAGDDFP